MRTAAAVIVIVFALAMLFVRVQPTDSATIFRNGSRLTVRRTPVYVRAAGVPCRVPRLGDRIPFQGNIAADEFAARVRFAYAPPSSLPRDWPDGDWCTSLMRRVRLPHIDTAELLDHQREAGDRVAAFIERDLPFASNISVRIDLPSGFERLRPLPEVASRSTKTRPVIFIGLDGADWNLLDPLMASGAMPNLKKLVESGTRGPLATELPPLSPIVWTTMMTGVSPLEHQILDFTRFNPATHEKEPITSDERRAPAIWNMLTYGGKSCAQFGLWATYAAEPLRAINVSDRQFTFLYSSPGSGAVYPPNEQPWAEAVSRAVESSIDLERVRDFIPSATEGDLATSGNPYANPVSALRRILIDTEIYRRLSLQYLKTHQPDLTIVYFEGTDSIGHEFAPFAPPKQPRVSQADYDRYSAVPEKYFRYIDTIIGDYARLDATIVIASDHGFRWTEGRPTEISSTATATAAKWHAPFGIFVGPRGVAPPRTIRDICAYLRHRTGMPEMNYGRLFQRAAAPPNPSGQANDEALAKLRALGYIGSGEATRPAVPQSDTKTGGAYNNEGLILRKEHRIDAAIAAFEHALQIDPHYASAMWNLSETLFDSKRDLDRADDLLVGALQNGLADAPKFVIQRSIAYHNARSLRLLERAVAVSPNDAELRLFRGRYRMDRRDCNGALADFVVAEQSNNALAFASAGLAQMCLGDAAAAQASFARARRLDPSLQLPR